MDIALVLEDLGFSGEDWGPDISTPEALAANWRGRSACPTAAALTDRWVQIEARRATQKLSGAKAEKRRAFIAECMRRIAVHVPELDSEDVVKAAVALWPSVGGAATPALISARDLYLWTRDTAIPKLAAVNDLAAVETIDPGADDPFGDGTFWPS